MRDRRIRTTSTGFEGVRTAKVDGATLAYREQGSHERDRRVGTWSEYYSDGVLRARGSYSWCENPPSAGRLKGQRSPTAGRGCKMGRWSYWTQSGDVLRTRDYDEINRPDPRSGRGAASIGVVGM